MQMMVIPYFYTEYIDNDVFSIHILEIQMVIDKYSDTEDVDDDGLDDDVLMKALSRVKFEHFRDKIGVVQKDLPQKGEQ